jgi:hypothetical protein
LHQAEATPRQRKVRKVSSKVPSGGGSAVAERRLQGLKVLCVDDNNIVLSTLKRYVEMVFALCHVVAAFASRRQCF